jgi:tripartite-type tricarboxylate transporter receptor subunit TctC
VAKLSDDLIWALTQPDVRQRMANGGSTIVANRPEAFRRFLEAEIPRWARAVKTSGVKVD